MTKAELVSAIADRAGLNKAQAKDALDAFIASVATSLKDGKEVRLVGFGSFVPVKRAAAVKRSSSISPLKGRWPSIVLPMLRLFFMNDPPVPICPFRLDVQTRLDVIVPSCSSVAMPLKETEAPEA